MGQVAVEVGRSSARRGCQQHQAYGQRRRQAERFGQEEARQRQQQQLASQTDQYRFGKFGHAGEIA
ncbi:hypothetical protein JF55_09685 [Pseudomonas sp. 1-7]|nr:hypothetical protein JF55_09685 [Pseudomonas sp. 1-7]